jgi:hypothetical protein
MQNQELLEKYWHSIRSTPEDLRAAGLTVAVHNDYRQNDEPHTFWLMTYLDGQKTIALKGEGMSDEAALDLIRAQWAKLSDDHHHAPRCPANHYHGQRAPTGACSCGAVEHGVKMGRS